MKASRILLVRILMALFVCSTLFFDGCGPSQLAEDEVQKESVVPDGDKDDQGGSPVE